ncbi:hypothetical protein BpHYR1_013128 [Brachionus plicatilis]|uniref:Uncharacterized protein n=1 Tax=Brachionus plicatilis TaxID=10195 RepID=A0A3M7Q9K0_BRAPC|nr:hypothetical protein BpHYR1_013128 [Brachionus plicatilis]
MVANNLLFYDFIDNVTCVKKFSLCKKIIKVKKHILINSGTNLIAFETKMPIQTFKRCPISKENITKANILQLNFLKLNCVPFGKMFFTVLIITKAFMMKCSGRKSLKYLYNSFIFKGNFTSLNGE